MYIILCNDISNEIPSLIIIGTNESKEVAQKIAAQYLKDIFDKYEDELWYEWDEIVDDNDNVNMLEDVNGHNYYISIIEVNKNVYVSISIKGVIEGFPEVVERLFGKTEFKDIEEVISTLKEFEDNIDNYYYDSYDFDYDNLLVHLCDDELSQEIRFVYTSNE